MSIPKKYNCQNVEVVVAALIVCKNFRDHQAELIEFRPAWTDPFIQNLEDQANTASVDILGIRSKSYTVDKTKIVIGLHKKLLQKLGLLKVQIEVDFPMDRKNTILNRLGFNSYYENASKGNQEAAIQLSAAMKKNMTPELKKEIIAKGINEKLIDEIISLAEPMSQAEVDQEYMKTISKELTAESIKELNAIYETTIEICKIASKYYKDDKVIKAKFTFSSILKGL